MLKLTVYTIERIVHEKVMSWTFWCNLTVTMHVESVLAKYMQQIDLNMMKLVVYWLFLSCCTINYILHHLKGCLTWCEIFTWLKHSLVRIDSHNWQDFLQDQTSIILLGITIDDFIRSNSSEFLPAPKTSNRYFLFLPLDHLPSFLPSINSNQNPSLRQRWPS